MMRAHRDTSLIKYFAIPVAVLAEYVLYRGSMQSIKTLHHDCYSIYFCRRLFQHLRSAQSLVGARLFCHLFHVLSRSEYRAYCYDKSTASVESLILLEEEQRSSVSSTLPCRCHPAPF